MRVTNKMLTTRYAKDLNNSLSTLNTMAQKVESGRSFFKGSEDPISAIKAYRLRREADQNDDHLANINEVDSILTSAESNLMNIQTNLKGIYTGYLKGMNGTESAETRAIYANELKSVRDSMISTLNANFNNKFLFSGDGMEEAPFEVRNGNELYYKGVKVTGVKAGAGYDKLKKLSEAKMQLDVGLSLNVDGGVVKDDSVMDVAIPGIRALGFGMTNVDGVDVPNNLYDLATEIIDLLNTDSLDYAALTPRLKQFEKRRDTVLKEITDLGSKTQYIDFLKTRADDDGFNITKKIQNVEFVDPAKAIIDWRMQDYTYNAALQMGNKIIQPSFIDFMR